jgi:hypothetical protein
MHRREWAAISADLGVDYKGKEFEGGKFWTGQGRLASKEK